MVRLGCGGLWGRFSGQEGEGGVRRGGVRPGTVWVVCIPSPAERAMRSHRRAKLWRAQELHPVSLEERAHLLRAVLVAVDHGAAELAAGLRGRSPVEASRGHGAAPKRAAVGLASGARKAEQSKGVLLSNRVPLFLHCKIIRRTAPGNHPFRMRICRDMMLGRVYSPARAAIITYSHPYYTPRTVVCRRALGFEWGGVIIGSKAPISRPPHKMFSS